MLAESATSHRRILSEYSPYLLDQMIAVVTASTLMGYALYTVSPATIEKFGTDRLLWTFPFPLYGIFRYLYLVHQKQGGGSPAEMLLTDRPLLVCVALWAVSVVLIVYRPIGSVATGIENGRLQRSLRLRRRRRDHAADPQRDPGEARRRLHGRRNPRAREPSSSKGSSIRARSDRICVEHYRQRSRPCRPRLRVRGLDALRVAPRRWSASSAGSSTRCSSCSSTRTRSCRCCITRAHQHLH